MKMTHYDMVTTENTSRTLCRILGAWIQKTALETTEMPDFEALFREAERHFLSAAACAALESTGLMAYCSPEIGERFRASRHAAVRRTLLMDAERGKILSEFEKNGIWYAPLKGVILNTLYPRYGTRQFADNDILFDASRWRDVKKIMKGRGFTAYTVGKGAHDVYRKPPVYNFEMHRMLFDNMETPFACDCAVYYENVKSRLIKDNDNAFGYHFGDEDFYIFFLAHAYKHYDGSGTGLRTLLDLYLYRRSAPFMDESRVAAELQRLGLTEFEAVCRSLSDKLFFPDTCAELTEKEQDMLRWVESSGVYGTLSNRIITWLSRSQIGGGQFTWRTRAKYLFRRVFPDRNWYMLRAPFAYRHPWAVPFFWVRRLFRGVFVNGRRNLREAGEVCALREDQLPLRNIARERSADEK